MSKIIFMSKITEKIYFEHYLNSISEKSAQQATTYRDTLKICMCYMPLHCSLIMFLFIKFNTGFINYMVIFFAAISSDYLFNCFIKMQQKTIQDYAILADAAFETLEEFCNNNNVYSFYYREYDSYEHNSEFNGLHNHRIKSLDVFVKVSQTFSFFACVFGFLRYILSLI